MWMKMRMRIVKNVIRDGKQKKKKKDDNDDHSPYGHYDDDVDF